MRTKNVKRLWPVPITVVAVFALAAFLAAGLFVPNDAQALDREDDCGFQITGGNAADAFSPSEDGDGWRHHRR